MSNRDVIVVVLGVMVGSLLTVLPLLLSWR